MIKKLWNSFIADIRHVVLLMIENRPFDHYFGFAQQQLKGIDGLKALDYEKYKGRMGRVIEMVGRQYLNNDGVTELATILLDARPADRANGDNCNGVWVQVPLENIEIQ